MREKMMRFMQGRYGVDQFTNFLMKLFFGEFIFYFLFRRLVPELASIMYYLSLATLVYTYYRIFYRIYKCPTCKRKVRVPKGKGKISIHCPKCDTYFIKRS